MTFKNSKWKNIVLLSSVFFVIVILFQIFPDYAGLIHKVKTLVEQKDEISEGKKNQKILTNVLNRHKDLKNEIGSYVSNYNENKNISSIITILYNAAKKCNLTISSIRPSKVLQKNNLWLQPMEINFSTDYQNTYNFIKFIEKSRKVIIVKDLEMISSSKKKVNLDVKARIEVYLNL